MQLLVNGLIAGSLAALIAGGLALVYGVLGVFNLALGQMVLIGGYITWWLYESVGLSLPVSILGGLIAGGVLSLVIFQLFVEPFYRRHRFLPLVTTIALGMILDALILLLFEERPRTILPGIKVQIPFLSAQISNVQIVLIVVTFILLCLLAWMFHTTRLGRRLRAVTQHPQAALSLGIPAPLLHCGLFIASGILAAAGGIFLGIDQNLTPVLAFPMTIKAYAAIIAGGKGNIWGAILFAYIIAILEQLVVGLHWFGLFYIPAGYQASVALLFIIFFLLFRPDGLFAKSVRTA